MNMLTSFENIKTNKEYTIAIIISMCVGMFSASIFKLPEASIINVIICLFILLLFGILFFINFQLQYIFFIICAPFIIYLKGGGYNPYSLNELFISFGIILLFIQSIGFSKIKILKKQKYLLPLFLFIVWTFTLSIIHAPNPSAGFASFITHNKYVPLIIITPLLLTSLRKVKLVLLLIIITGVFTSIFSLYLFFIGKGHGTLFGMANVYRLSGIFPNENMLGVYLVSLIILYLGYRFRYRTTKIMGELMIDIIIILPMFILLLLTYSRRSWVVFIIGLFILITNNKKKFNREIIIFSVIILILSFFIIDYNNIILRLKTIFSFTYLSNLSRIELFDEYIIKIFSNFSKLFLGVGVGSVGPASIYNSQILYLDNYYLLLLAEFGIIGLSLYIWLLISILRFLWPRKDNSGLKESGNNNLVITCASSSIVIILSGFVGITNISFPINFYLWLFLGLALDIKNITEQHIKLYNGIYGRDK